MMTSALQARAAALGAARTGFVSALVVRAQRPASVRPGDAAIVLADGTIEGFVGGECAEASVRLHAARALETGEPLLLRILHGDADAPASEGAVTVQNPCLSGGALEIFLEPRLPAPVLVVVGDSPVAAALAELGGGLGYEVASGRDATIRFEGAAAVVVAGHGRGEEDALSDALAADVPYVGLVASTTRGAAVLEALSAGGTADDALARVRTPAGLDIGARGAAEIALSILAEVVALRRKGTSATAVDPVCGMEVAALDSSPHVDRDGRRVYFCGHGCRVAFETAHPAAV